MARSSRGPHRAKTWATEQNPRPAPRIVRLGRPANDNTRHFGPTARKLVVLLASAVVVLAVALYWLI